MLQASLITLDDLKNLNMRISSEINSSWAAAEKDPYPSEKEMLERVYKND